MVLSMLIALNTAPALLGTNEAIRQGQAKEKREEHRARRCNLIANCTQSSKRSSEIDGRRVVLVNNKLYIDTGTGDDSLFGHPFAGYYLPYPDASYEGLVTTITDEAPILNWVYIDQETYEAKYGIRAEAQPNFTGPFSCTRQDRRLTFGSWEGFLAVEEEPFLWAVYFDVNDDGLKGKIRPGVRVLEIELSRKEKRWKKEIEERKEDQNTVHAADENQTMRGTTAAEAAEQNETPAAPSEGPGEVPTPGLPSKGLELSKVDLTLGPGNSNHTSQSKMLSRRLARSNLKLDMTNAEPSEGQDDDTTSVTTEAAKSVFSEGTRMNYTPASSVQGEDPFSERQPHPLYKQSNPVPKVPDIPEEFSLKPLQPRKPQTPPSDNRTRPGKSPKSPGPPKSPKSRPQSPKSPKSRPQSPKSRPQSPKSPKSRPQSPRSPQLSKPPRSPELPMNPRQFNIKPLQPRKPVPPSSANKVQPETSQTSLKSEEKSPKSPPKSPKSPETVKTQKQTRRLSRSTMPRASMMRPNTSKADESAAPAVPSFPSKRSSKSSSKRSSKEKEEFKAEDTTNPRRSADGTRDRSDSETTGLLRSAISRLRGLGRAAPRPSGSDSRPSLERSNRYDPNRSYFED